MARYELAAAAAQFAAVEPVAALWLGWLVYVIDCFLGVFHVVSQFLPPTFAVFVRVHIYDTYLFLPQFPQLFSGGFSHIA